MLLCHFHENGKARADVRQPNLWLLNFMTITIRQGISVAPLGGMNDDLGLTGTQFSTVVSIHYVAYILGQIPSNLLLTRLPPSIALGIGSLIAGIIAICMAAVKDFKGLLVQRFVLGLMAAPTWAGTRMASFYYDQFSISHHSHKFIY